MSKRIALSICAVIALAAAPALSEEITDYGDMPIVTDTPIIYIEGEAESLRAAQQCLINLGLLTGSADGVYGPRTEAALHAFQESNDLPASGHLDDDTLALLTQLSSGDASTADIQQRLIDLGYLVGKADGIWGPRSTTALTAFQQLNGLTENGIADRDTLAALFADGAVALPTGLYAGQKGSAVKEMQQALIRLGFYNGTADGDYGQSTANAVLACQKHLVAQGHTLTANGTASPLTLFYIESEDYSSYLRDIAVGDTDSEAQRVERRLVRLGYMDAKADTEFDAYAAEALALFQEAAGLPADGVADKATFDALFASSAPEAQRCALHAVASGDRGKVVRYVEQALLRDGLTAEMPDGDYDETLETAVERFQAYEPAVVSDKARLSVEAVSAIMAGLPAPDSSDASRIQRRLYALYYLDKSGIDGKQGESTRKALKAFQEANGLDQTGEADAQTLAALFSEAAVAKPYPYRVDVDIDAQWVTIYQLKDDGSYEAVRSFTCSTGLHNTTPRGVFLDGFPVNRWHYFKKFDCWAQYSFEIEGNIMFHSVLYSDQDVSTLREGSVWALGTPASHGCIRLQVEDAKYMFEHCKRGTVVIVIH